MAVAFALLDRLCAVPLLDVLYHCKILPGYIPGIYAAYGGNDCGHDLFHALVIPAAV